MLDTALCVFAFRRPAHLQLVLSSLLANCNVNLMPIYIFIDGPRCPGDLFLQSQILSIVHDKVGHLKPQIHVYSENIGLFLSLTGGINYVLGLHKSVIVIEDDIVVSPFFLDYMINAIAYYSDIDAVASIHGYTPPISDRLPETFFLRGADCWGWATWRDRWKLFRHDASVMVQEIRERNLVREFNLNGNFDYLSMLVDKGVGRNNSWAICWHASCFLADKLTLYPGSSLVKNVGLDYSGENCGPSELMETNLRLSQVRIMDIPLEVNLDVFRSYSNHFKARNISKLRFLGPARQIYRALRRVLRKNSSEGLMLKGPFVNYEEAHSLASGYNSPIILDKVYLATIDLLEGRGVYERDGSIFPSRPEGLKIRQIIKRSLEKNMTVVDFGGGLGGTFINNRDLFDKSHKCIVIEQPNFVEAGQKLSLKTNLDLHFYTSLGALNYSPDILIFSSVLQYLPDSSELLIAASLLEPNLIILDRTAFSRDGLSKWWLQVEPLYYGTPISYPIRPLSESTILKLLKSYSVVEHWTNDFDPQQPLHWGLLFQRRI